MWSLIHCLLIRESSDPDRLITSDKMVPSNSREHIRGLNDYHEAWMKLFDAINVNWGCVPPPTHILQKILILLKIGFILFKM